MIDPLDLTTNAGDGEERTLREFFKELLKKIMREGALFNSKRPWGNSSWELSIYKMLISQGVIPGKLDEDDHVESMDDETAERVMMELIERM